MQVVLFEPYPLQKEFIDRFVYSDNLIGVVSAPRGSGKSLLAMNLALFFALDKEDQSLAWIAPIYNQARNVFDQIVDSTPEAIASSNRMELLVKFINGSTLKFLSADSPDSIRGYRFSHVICDEAAFFKERIIDQYILPTLNPSGKKLLLISTPKGKNTFYNYFIDQDTISMRFPLSECPYVKDEVVGEAKKSLPPDIFRQEFLGEFVDSSNDVFLNVDQVSTVKQWSDVRTDVYIGVDTGLSNDMSVLTIMNPAGRVLKIESLNGENINVIANHFSSIMSNYNVVGGYIECNGVGQAMYDLISPKFRRIKKFHMTQQIKTDIVRKLIHDMETYTIELPTTELCPELHQEFPMYSYKLSQTGKLSFGHIPGGNDDFIDSLMMANYSRVKFMEKKPIRVANFRTTTPMFKRPS